MAERAIAELGGERHLTVRGPEPADAAAAAPCRPGTPRSSCPPTTAARRWRRARPTARRWQPSAPRARRRRAGRRGRATPPTPTNSPRRIPDRFFEMYIAEQQMVAAAVGLSVRGYRPFASTFAAFLTRAYDFIRMAAISRAEHRLFGSHAGVEIGADGPSQMALEDLAMMRAVHGSTVLYPVRRHQTAALVAGHGRPATASATCAPPAAPTRCSTTPARSSRSAAARCCAPSDDDQVTLIGAGSHRCTSAWPRPTARRRGHQRPGHRPVLGQAASTPTRCSRRPRRHQRPARHRRGPPPGGRPRLRGRRRPARRRPRRCCDWPTWPSASMPGSGTTDGAARTPPASTPKPSPRPPGACSPSCCRSGPSGGAGSRRPARTACPPRCR